MLLRLVVLKFKVKVSVDYRKKVWKEHMENLMIVENEWSNSIDASKVEGKVSRTEVEEVWCAINSIKTRKKVGPLRLLYIA